VTKGLRKHWQNTGIIWRADGHSGRVEEIGTGGKRSAPTVFGLAGNPALDAWMAETSDNLRFHQTGDRIVFPPTGAAIASSTTPTASNSTGHRCAKSKPPKQEPTVLPATTTAGDAKPPKGAKK
jgi:hypothetical protein